MQPIINFIIFIVYFFKFMYINGHIIYLFRWITGGYHWIVSEKCIVAEYFQIMLTGHIKTHIQELLMRI